ncbi:MAG TPA: M23 family metallopeptidase [Anaeromyxobacteraceae bacterium]|nr:M23 family metallopeptidase [Anaeromyxobacteraceae bacterium]
MTSRVAAGVISLAALVPVLAAAAAPSIHVAPETARPGDVVLVTVHGAPADAAPTGAAAGRPLRFWMDGDRWCALAPLPTETPPGPAPVEAVLADGTLLPYALPIREPGFRASTLKVAPRYVAPPAEVQERIEADRLAFAAASARPFGPPLFAGAFALPREARFTGRFGDQRVFNGEKSSVHYGLDLAGPVGVPIGAANDGEVALVHDGYYAGNAVVLSHGAGVYTIYFHLSRVDVRPGQPVRRGEIIGALGDSGRVTGPHLHWSVKVDGLYVDPESLLRLPLGTAR